MSMGASQCSVGNAPEFKWYPKIYVADARTESIVRKDGDKVEQIMCRDQKFDSMICVHNSEIRKAKQAAYDVINQCERWKTGAAPAHVDALSEALTEAELLHQDLHSVDLN